MKNIQFQYDNKNNIALSSKNIMYGISSTAMGKVLSNSAARNEGAIKTKKPITV